MIVTMSIASPATSVFGCFMTTAQMSVIVITTTSFVMIVWYLGVQKYGIVIVVVVSSVRIVACVSKN